MVDRMVIGLAMWLLRKHSILRYRRCRTPEMRRRAIAGQALGLIQHDCVITGRFSMSRGLTND